MARGGVTFTEVDVTARYLQGVGKNPTVDAIREHLGTGSRTTLHEHLKRWKSLQENSESRLPKPLFALVSGLWESLQSMAAQQVQENQSLAQQEVATMKSQLLTAQHAEMKANHTLHQLQEALNAEQHAKTALEMQLKATEKSHEVLSTAHQSMSQQLDNAKQENQRLHHLATQIQANLEHYQQAMQQQQIEQNLEKEKQYSLYAQKLSQLKALLDEEKTHANQSEKALITSQHELHQLNKNYQALKEQHEKIVAQHQTTEHALIQLTAETNVQKQQFEKNTQDLLAERHAHNQLQQKMAVLAEQHQRATHDLRQAEDKIEALRQEKLFLSQEKAQIEGALKQLQGAKAAA